MLQVIIGDDMKFFVTFAAIVAMTAGGAAFAGGKGHKPPRVHLPDLTGAFIGEIGVVNEGHTVGAEGSVISDTWKELSGELFIPSEGRPTGYVYVGGGTIGRATSFDTGGGNRRAATQEAGAIGGSAALEIIRGGAKIVE